MNTRSKSFVALLAAAAFTLGTALSIQGTFSISHAQTITGPDNQVGGNQTATTVQSAMPASSNKTFYVFSESIQGLDHQHEEGGEMHMAGVHPYKFSPAVIVANQGDNVTVHFYSTEEGNTTERHSFTIDAQPYNVSIDIGPGENGNATFVAEQPGIYPFYCIYHLPNMKGQLVVLPETGNQTVATIIAGQE